MRKGLGRGMVSLRDDGVDADENLHNWGFGGGERGGVVDIFFWWGPGWGGRIMMDRE